MNRLANNMRTHSTKYKKAEEMLKNSGKINYVLSISNAHQLLSDLFSIPTTSQKLIA